MQPILVITMIIMIVSNYPIPLHRSTFAGNKLANWLIIELANCIHASIAIIFHLTQKRICH